MALIATLIAAAPAAAKVRTGTLERELGPGVTAERQSETGSLRFIGTEPGKPIEAPVEGSAREVALGFADSLAPELGTRGDRLAVTETASLGGGDRSVRMQQVHDGVPVIGGELVVNLDRDRDVLSLSGETLPNAELDTEPSLSAAEADDIALADFSRRSGVDAAELSASKPELSILDSRILGGEGLGRPTLVWRTEITPRDPDSVAPIREFVAVDAQAGVVALSFSQIADAKNRVVCDANNTTDDVPCTAPDYERTEGGPVSGINDVNLAYDYAGDTYDFFFDRFARDSLNGAGLQLASTTRYCDPSESCPYANAFWNGQQMVYGDGFAAADDVVGHELTHGVTEFSSNLFYYYQSGAINESMSDVFGEFVDLTNGAGTDTPAVRWQLGEDVPGFGAIRDMQDPTAFGDPDRMQSPNYWTSNTDSGGVHTNSGVNNKAAYLIADGDTFNSQTVAGLGIEKAARIYYRVNNSLLTSASDYQDLASALRQACSELTGTAGITASDCAQVDKAVLATEMDQVPASIPATDAETCTTPGDVPQNLFYDDLENPASGNWTSSAATGSNRWYYPQNPNPQLDATYASSGDTNFYADSLTSGSSVSYIAMTEDVTLPANALMHFSHAYSIKPSGGGGLVQYSTNGGATWTGVSGSWFEANGYDDFVFPFPGSGQLGFTGKSYGYISSRLDLSSLAGQSVRFRFGFGKDSTGGYYGWFIDDPRIYTCAPPDTTPPQTQIDSGPANGSTITAASATFTFSSNEAGSSFQCSADGGPFGACNGSGRHTMSGLAEGTHNFAVRAKDGSGNLDATPASRSFTVKQAVDDACATATAKLEQAAKQLRNAGQKAKKATKKARKAKKKAKKANGKKAKKLKKKSKRLRKKAKKAKQAKKAAQKRVAEAEAARDEAC